MDDDNAPVTLYQFPPVWGRNVSPFTLKLESWLRLAGVPYRVSDGFAGYRRAPKGKLPYIEDDGLRVADSSLIIRYLCESRGIDLDGWLSERQRAEALALQRLFEDHFYFILAYARWIDPDGWPTVKEGYFSRLPPGVRNAAALALRRRVRRTLHHQGLGRHSRSELYEMGRADLEAIAVVLGAKPFFFGDRPATIDAVAYGFLANLLLVPVETELKRIGEGFPNLGEWCGAMETALGGSSG
jgi:glutathione S-transferase